MVKTEAEEEAADLARELIAYSESYDTIAREDFTPELHAELARRADDYTDTNEGVDYWGPDWRIELIR